MIKPSLVHLHAYSFTAEFIEMIEFKQIETAETRIMVWEQIYNFILWRNMNIYFGTDLYSVRRGDVYSVKQLI